MQTIKFKAGDTILSEGEEGNTAFVVVDGSAEVTVGAGNRAKVVGTLKAGDIFGEMSLLEPGPRSATVKAVTDTECIVTTYDEFMASIHEHPERAVDFSKTLIRRLRQMNALMSSMDPHKRGLRERFSDWQKSVAPPDRDLSDEERLRRAEMMMMGYWGGF
jgi:CRP/FNR family transcriptional regulator, cyclic AMP receptor protein